MTILRNRDTQRGDFIFYADRLSTLIVEKALTYLSFQPTTVTTPMGLTYDGVQLPPQVGQPTLGQYS